MLLVDATPCQFRSGTSALRTRGFGEKGGIGRVDHVVVPPYSERGVCDIGLKQWRHDVFIMLARVAVESDS